MSAAPTTTAVRPPLDGGREGATVTLHPLLTGELLVPPGLRAREGGPLRQLRAIGVGAPRSRWSWIPAPAFLVEHPGAGPLLVDTGVHPGAERDPRATMGRTADRLYDIRVGEGQALRNQIARRGVDPDGLRTLIMTHLHIDHAAGLSEFPGTQVLVDAGELRAARRLGGFLRGYNRRHVEQPVTWRTVDFRGAEAASHDAFDRTIDLFGDGSVRLISTPGHTVGHLSVLLRLGDRSALLTGDAAYTRRTIDDTVLPGLTQDEGAFRRSLAQIQRYATGHPDALVVPGHDAEAWAQLRPVYA